MKLNQPVPELPVVDVEGAQEYYRDVLGCEIEWTYPGKEVGAVSSGETAIFFRRREGGFEPSVHWIYSDEVDSLYNHLKTKGALIVEPIEDKPWGLRQFTIADNDGNQFHIHQDIAVVR